MKTRFIKARGLKAGNSVVTFDGNADAVLAVRKITHIISVQFASDGSRWTNFNQTDLFEVAA